MVTIRPDPDFERVGLFDMDTSQVIYRHVSISGIVVSAPKKLNYFGREAQSIRNKGRIRSYGDQKRLSYLNQYGTSYDVPIEIKEGDRVMYKSLSVSDSPLEGELAVIRYDNLICKVGENGLYPLNGHVLVEPLEEFSDFDGVTESTRTGTVRYAGCKVAHYRDFPKQNDGEVFPGDEVLFMKTYNKPMEYDLYRQLPIKLFYMHRRNILGIKT